MGSAVYITGRNSQKLIDRKEKGMEKPAGKIMAVWEACGTAPNMTFFRDYAQVEDRIYVKLVNYEKNKELLKNIPHTKWLDLAAVFYYAMEWQGKAGASILLYHSHLAMWGKAEEEIRRSAKRNMERDMPGRLVSLGELVMELTGIAIKERCLCYN